MSFYSKNNRHSSKEIMDTFVYDYGTKKYFLNIFLKSTFKVSNIVCLCFLKKVRAENN